jgi:predicted permease
MTMWRRLNGWLARLRPGAGRDDDLDREIQTHLELEAEDRHHDGLSARDAHAAARRAFGNPVSVRDAVRDVRRLVWIDHVVLDVRLAVRQLRRAPGFSAAAILTLALGTGANTAIFSIINGFLRPLPVPDADRVVVLANVLPRDETGLKYRFSYPALEDFRRATDAFADVFGFDIRLAGLTANGHTSQFVYHVVTGNFFSGLGVAPAAGRLFRPGEGEEPHAESLIVLGHAYWLRRFGGDPAVVGSVLRLNGRPARVIGVAQAGFTGLQAGAEMDGYLPIGADAGVDEFPGRYRTDRSRRWLVVAARLRDAVTIDQARAAADVVARDLATAYPATEADTSVRVIPERLARPLPVPFLGRILPVVRTLLFVLASMVLLIACMNVANLLLVRATVRQREMAVRAALGAGRRRLVRLLVTESLVLAAAGTGLGLLTAQSATYAFANAIDLGTDIGLHLDFRPDWRVFSYALAVALLTGLIVGVLPAVRASRAAVTDLLHDGGRGSAGPRRQRLRSGLVVAQVAGSFALLVVAGLFTRSLQAAQRIDLGFDPDRVLTLRLDPEYVGYDLARTRVFFEDLERRLEALPGVESVSTSFSLPLGYYFGGQVLRPEGAPETSEPGRDWIHTNSVGPDYFATLRIPIVRGRAFDRRDTSDSTRVAIVNETLAARFWPGRDPIGQRMDVPDVPGSAWEIVGVARDNKQVAVFEPPLPQAYLPQAQNPSALRAVALRSTQPLDELGARVAAEIAALDPGMPIGDLRPMREAIRGSVGMVMFRVGAWQATAMSVLGLVLAVLGVYGVVSYRTAQRGREIGIRVALGALPADVRRLVIGQGAALVLAGLAAGLVVAFALTRIIARALLIVSANDPATFAGVTVLLAATALAACYLPARRAERADPVAVLRHE